jgi:hypothetical protein
VSLRRVVLLGLAAGALVWIRYAAAFVPVGIGICLLVQWLRGGRPSLKVVSVYAASSLTPILLLLAINRAYGSGLGTQYQLIPPGFENPYKVNAEMFSTIWARFTEQTPYYYRPEQKWFFSLVLPVGGLLLPLVFAHARRALREFFARPPVLLSVILTATVLLVMLITTAAFGRYVYGVPRHYQPIGPFYFLLFVGPVLTFRWRLVRVAACVPLVLVCSWYLNQDVRPAYARRLADDPVVTEYGRQARHFEPGSRILYDWLRAQDGDDLVVFSRLPHEIALETRIPACYLPLDREEMTTVYLERIARARGVEKLRVLFVVDPRSVRDLPEIVGNFDLVHPADVPSQIQRYVYVPAGWES